MAENTEKYFPFDGTDREYKADDFARYYRAFITSGLFMNDSTNLQVMADTGMHIKVKPGAAIIDGYRYDNTGNIGFTLQAADGLLSRIDRVVIRWDKELREIYAAVLRGTPAANPVAPAITRNSDIREYAIAEITISAGAALITQADILDTRMDSAICGEALPWAELDTHTLAIQFETWIQQTIESGDAAALALLEEMRDILDGSAAGHLQNEIDALLASTVILKNRTLTFSNKVATIQDSRITAETYALVYFTEATASEAEEADVTVTTGAGVVTFVATNEPASSLVCDVVVINNRSRFIENISPEAMDVPYDNSASGLESDRVQGAIDELKSIIDDKPDTEDIPTKLSQLEEDGTHRLTTDTEKTIWNRTKTNLESLGLSVVNGKLCISWKVN